MFKIDYRVDEVGFADVVVLTAEDIGYNIMLGSIVLHSSESRIELDWDWIPLLDFALGMKRAVGELQWNGQSATFFEFTENAETLILIRNEARVRVSRSGSAQAVETTLTLLELAVRDLCLRLTEQVRSLISGELPEVLNRHLANLND